MCPPRLPPPHGCVPPSSLEPPQGGPRETLSSCSTCRPGLRPPPLRHPRLPPLRLPRVRPPDVGLAWNDPSLVSLQNHRRSIHPVSH